MPDEREVETPWLLAHCTTFPALDVGCAESRYLTDLPGPVDGIDLRPPIFPGLREFFQDDIRTWTPEVKYPTVIALSTVEHIGLQCDAYGTPADDVPNGDRLAVEGCMRALTPDGVLILTVPWGSTENFGWYRRYDKTALDWLLRGYRWEGTYHSNSEWQVGGVCLARVWHS